MSKREVVIAILAFAAFPVVYFGIAALSGAVRGAQQGVREAT